MSRFFNPSHANLTPYVPGEQPRDMKYIKLNTNESPFPPSPKAVEMAGAELERLYLYPDPVYKDLTRKLAETLDVREDEIVVTNGSDEVLSFAFQAFGGPDRPAVFADITYGFYTVFANLYNIPETVIPLKPDFSLDINDYLAVQTPGVVFIANPNAPTGLLLTVDEIETLVRSCPQSVFVIDEAYIDFGGRSCVPLIHKYDNILITQTFSKSRSMAGARLGFGVGCPDLIADLQTVRNSTNPYNVSKATAAAALGALCDDAYMRQNCLIIEKTRERVTAQLRELGFVCTDSYANFIFASHPAVPGKKIYEELKARGILVRHFETPRLSAYNRITVGTDRQMDCLISAVSDILKGV